MLFLTIKLAVVIFALFIPLEAFVAPDVLEVERLKLIQLTNHVRTEKGLPTLFNDALLDQSAQQRAEDMSAQQYMSQVSPNGHQLGYFLANIGYSYKDAGENLAMGFSDADTAMSAWLKSPTHYANIIHPTYEQFGVGIQGGIYKGKPTVFVAQHFASPQRASLETAAAAEPGMVIRASAPAEGLESPTVTAIVTQPVKTYRYNPDQSFVEWEEQGSHTLVRVRAVLSGDIMSAKTILNGYTIDLKPKDEGTYAGVLTISESTRDVFRAIVASTLQIETRDGVIHNELIEWQNPKVVSETPWQRYLQARSWLYTSVPVFPIVHTFYMIALVFFVITFAIALVVEVRKQHPRLILRTLGLLTLLVWCVTF